LFNVEDNPFKVKIPSSESDKSFIVSELNKYKYPIHDLKINYANEELNSKIKDFKDLLLC
jgi:putative ABC transport system permease protein